MLDFHSKILGYSRNVVGLDEDDNQLILKYYISLFITYEIPAGIYSIKDFSAVLYTMSDHDGTMKIEYDDISMKAKPNLSCFGGAF